MRSTRHALAHVGHLVWGLVLGVPLVIACRATPRDGLLIAGRPAELHELSAHVVIRIDAESLARAQSLVLHVSADGADAVVILPDDAAHSGTSFGRHEGVVGVRANASLHAALDSACDAEGVCEIGVAVIVEPTPDAAAPEPTEIVLSLDAATARGGSFLDSARLELEIDGEPPIVATRRSL